MTTEAIQRAPSAIGTPLTLSSEDIDSFLPMHVLVAPDGTIRHIGRTMERFQAAKPFVGQNLFRAFVFSRPKELLTMAELAQNVGQQLKAHLINGKVGGLRGSCVCLSADQGYLLNFGLGSGVHRVVNEFGLKATDFSATDPTAEFLYMTEMQSFLLAESVRLNHRLNGAKRSAEEQAARDPLTGLGNRRLLAQYLHRLQARSTPAKFALLHVDLDHFKKINDAFGHSAGDAVLQEVAKILQFETRPDDVRARIGGDEFVVVLGHIDDISQVQILADRLIAKISKPIYFADKSCVVGASIGAVMFDGSWTLDPLFVFEAADRLLYTAKSMGRGCAVIETLKKPEHPV